MDEQTTEADKLDVFGRVFTLKDDLRQRDVAAWNRVFVEQTRGTVATAVERQASLQGAIEAGWILSPETRHEQVVTAAGTLEKRYYFDGVLVDDMPPAQVNYYGRICSRLYDTLMAIPKGSSSA
jgi:hypothetical protein